MLTLVPLPLKEANAFVAEHHRYSLRHNFSLLFRKNKGGNILKNVQKHDILSSSNRETNQELRRCFGC